MRSLILATALVASPLMAEEAVTFSGGAEFGATKISGNTDTTTVKSKIEAVHLVGELENRYLLDFLFAEDNEERSAERYIAEYQMSYPANQVNYFFGLVNGEVDKFSGYEYTLSAVAGYGRQIIHKDHIKLRGELGPGYSFKSIDRDVAPDADDERDITARFKLDFWYGLSDHAEFSQLLLTDVAFGGPTLSRSETGLSANLVGNLAMKLSYIIRHNSAPVDDKQKTDTELAATLLYKF